MLRFGVKRRFALRHNWLLSRLDPVRIDSVWDEPNRKLNDSYTHPNTAHRFMNQLIDRIRPVALYIVLLNAGLYAGLHFSGLMSPLVFGIINSAGDLMPSTTWAASWQITNKFMSVRMGIYGQLILWSYVLTILVFVRRWRSATFWLLMGAFGLFIADIVLTIQHQMPISQYIEGLDFKHITPEQAKNLAIMHPQVIQNFSSREWFSIVGFVLVAMTPFIWQKTSRNQRLAMSKLKS